jgi:hypothetical protein
VAFSLVYLGLCRALSLVASSRRCEADKDVELVVLRHQVRVLERQLHGRVRYRRIDRALLAALSRLLPRDRWQAFLVTPATLSVGTDRPDDGSGGRGGASEAQGALR